VNEQVAAELHLSLGAIKMHSRQLFTKFGLEDVRQNEKRLRLASEAIDAGAVARDDVTRDG
jgi:DNA-binding NarL/FixJ family response regulator